MGRPSPRFEDFIGHKRIVAMLRCQLEGSRARGQPMPHLLITGPSGVGKTALARALAAHRGTNLIHIMGTVSPEELIEKLKTLQHGDFLFIDEAHNMHPDLQELFFEVIDENTLRVPASKAKAREASRENAMLDIKPFTLVLATNLPSRLCDALKKRMLTSVEIPRYNLKEMSEIVATIATENNIFLAPQARNLLAGACDGFPRNAKKLLTKLPYSIRPDSRQISKGDIKKFLRDNLLTMNGWGPSVRRYLYRLDRFEFASLERMALALEIEKDIVLREIEPSLIRKNFVQITSKGRKLTPRGERWVRSRQRSRARRSNDGNGGGS